METFKFKTNIMCDGCIASVTPVLNELNGVKAWNVDINNAQKILTVESEGASESDIVTALKTVGKTAERI